MKRRPLLLAGMFIFMMCLISLDALSISGPISGVTVGAQSATLTQGTAGSVTYDLTISYIGLPTAASFSMTLSMANWSAPAGVTSGWSAPTAPGTWFGTNPYNNANMGSSSSGTITGSKLTLNTTSSTPAGTYTFNVKVDGNAGSPPAAPILVGNTKNSNGDAGSIIMAPLASNSVTSLQVTLLVGSPACPNPTRGGTIAAEQTICYNTSPSEITSTALPGGHTGTLEYKWQSSTTSASSGFVDIGSATGTSYSPGALTQATWFKRLSKVTTCSEWPVAGESNVVKITVWPNFSPGAVNTTGETICYNGNPGSIGSSSAASGGDGNYTYKWQSSANGTFSDSVTIAGATASTYDPGSLTSTTTFRRMAKDGSCSNFTLSTGTWKVTVLPEFIPGEISTTGESVCYNGDPGEIGSVTDASGGEGSITYKWQSSASGNFTDAVDINTATGTTYDPGQLTATTTFRRMAKDETCSGGFSAATGTWTVTVYEDFVGGGIGSDQTICYNSAPAMLSGLIPTGGSLPYSYQWQEGVLADSPGLTFNDITGATAITYQPGQLTAPAYYRLKQTSSSGCGTVISDTVSIAIMPSFISGAINTDGETICYNGNPGEIASATDASGGNSSITYKWQSSANGTFSDSVTISGATAASYDPGALTSTTTFRRMAKDGACQTTFAASTGTWTVTVYEAFEGAGIGSDQSICYNTSPAELSGVIPTGGLTPYSYQWQSAGLSDLRGINFTDISGATNITYQPGSLKATTYYRLKQTSSGGCGTLISDTVTITVYDTLVAGTISADQSICHNTTPAQLTSVDPTGGNTPFNYQWQSTTSLVSDAMPYGTPPPGFQDISGATASTYQPGALTVTTYFRLKQTSASGCGTVISDTVTVTVYSALAAGTIAADQSICHNTTPALLTSSGPTGGNTPYTYQWQNSTDNVNFADIASATQTTFQPGTLTTTTYYRLKQTSASSCGTVVSDTVTITVYDTLVAGSISADQTICYNATPAELTSIDATGGNTPYTYQWQSAALADDPVLNFSDISGATISTYQPGQLTTTTYFRLKQTSASSCGSVITDTVTITVYDTIMPGTISADQSICYNTTPAQLTSVNPTGGNTPYTYQWQSTELTPGDFQPDTFTDIPGATSTTYQPGALKVSMEYRLKQTSASGCGTVKTNVVTVTVYDSLVAGTISADQSICYNTAPSLLNSVDPTGGNTPYTYQWQSTTESIYDHASYGTPPAGFQNISGATNSTYQPATLNITTHYRLRQTSASGCGTVTTDTLTITVEPTPVTGTLAKTPDEAEVCEGSDVSAALTAGTGGNGVDSLYYRTKTGGTWTDWAEYTSGSTIETAGVTDVEVLTWRNADYCTDAEADTVAWIVSPQTGGGAVTGGTLVCYGSNSTLLTLSGHTGAVQKWQYSTDGSSWIDISSHTATTYTAEDLTEDTYYRAVVSSGVCGAVNSDSTQITIKTDYKISGYARYNNNPLTKLDGLKITLKQNGSIVGTPVITGSTGYYEFTNLINGTYSIEVSSSHPSGNWQTWGGVTNSDYMLVAQHISNGTAIPVNPPVARVSASVKVPHPLINNADAIAIRQAAKYPLTGFSYFDIPKWVFSGLDQSTRIDTFELSCADVTREIRGLCAGDVNGTYVPGTGYKVAGMGLELVNRGTIGVANEMTFGVRADHQMELGAITLFMNFDPKQIEITNVTLPGNAGTEPWFETNNGVLYIGWMSLEPLMVMENQPVLLVHARLVGQTVETHAVETHGSASLPQGADHIMFTLNETMVSELADGDGNVIEGAKLSMPGATNVVETLHATSLQGTLTDLVVYPNPATTTINAGFTSVDGGDITLEVLSLQGQVVEKMVKSGGKAGWQRLNVDVQTLPNGVYFLKVSNGGAVETRKFVVNR